jgi:hypothetical protein
MPKIEKPPSPGVVPFLVKWTPRAVAVAIGGYYGLGIGYDLGLLAIIDKIAIQVLKHLVGYAGVGAYMPTVQVYAAWGIRVTVGLGAGLIYDVCERGAISCYRKASLLLDRCHASIAY